MPEHPSASDSIPSPTSSETAGLQIRLLGGFGVAIGSRIVHDSEWRLRKAAAIVKLLALAPGHRLHREQILDTLWPDLDPLAAAHNLNQSIYVARRVLDPRGGRASPYLPLQGDSVALASSGPIWIDVDAFEEAVATARSAKDPTALQVALDLYADLLPEDRYEDWAVGRRTTLRELFLSALLELARLREDRREHVAAIAALRRAVAEESTHEEAQRALMRLYALVGQRHRALRQYQQLRAALDRELGVTPDTATEQLYRDILAGNFPTPASTTTGPTEPAPVIPARHNLPAHLTSFVGREREIANVRQVLTRARLCTLTGAGGCGKTRLALEVATSLVGEYSDGAWLVDLAPLADPALVPKAVASVLGVREQPGRSLVATLTEVLQTSELLLVLDNCEHLVDATAILADALLRSSPRLRVLATSRQPLGVAGEVIWRVPSLSLPSPKTLGPDGVETGADDVASAMASEAIRLFVERAQLVQPDFVVTERTVRFVVDICRRLDGMPLAIELAAARVNALSVDQIATRLEDRFRLLTASHPTTPSRHQTLRAAVEWSYARLGQTEQALFNRLAVFAGGFTLEAAEVVGRDSGLLPPDSLEVLSQLVDKSLVVAEAAGDGVIRYRLLETLREFGGEQLIARGELAVATRRHAEYFLGLAEQAEAALEGSEQAIWLGRLEGEHDNLRAALEWSAGPTGDVQIGLRLAGTLSRFWWLRGHFIEARAYLERLLARPGALEPNANRAKALYALGVVTFRHADYAAGDQDMARSHFEECLSIFRTLGDRPSIAATLRELGRVAIELGDWEAAHPRLDESLALERELSNRHGYALTLSSLGWLSLFEGDYVAARPRLEDSLATFRELGDKIYVGICLYFLGRLAAGLGDYATARARFVEILETLPLSHYRWGAPFVLEGFAHVAVGQGKAVEAVRLASAAARLRRVIGASIGPSWYNDLERQLAIAYRAIGDDAAAVARAEGERMTMEQALDYALSEVAP